MTVIWHTFDYLSKILINSVLSANIQFYKVILLYYYFFENTVYYIKIAIGKNNVFHVGQQRKPYLLKQLLTIPGRRYSRWTKHETAVVCNYFGDWIRNCAAQAPRK